jgi:O-antigen/teichoic acid export membrane protein
MPETEVNDVHNKARRGIRLLMIRQVALQMLTMVGGIVLARTLAPAMFGLFTIATFLVTAFALFADFGLAPSLIQRKNELAELDIQVAFTLQQALTTTIVIILLITAPWLVHLYHKAPPDTVWLVRSLAFSLFLTSWRTMSALQLERKLRYDRLALIEVG